MSLKNNEKNEAYYRIGLPEEKLNEVFERCVKDMNNEKNLSRVNFGTEAGVKLARAKKENNIFKYVAVAAFAVIASGAILGGVANYQSSKPAKTGVIASTEIPTEKVVTDNSSYKELIGNDKNISEFLQNRKAEIDGVKFEARDMNNNEYLYVKGKDDKDFKEVVDMYYVSNVYTNGEYIYYYMNAEGEQLIKYNIKDGKQEEIDVFKSVESVNAENVDKDTEQSYYYPMVVFNDVMYINLSRSWQDKGGIECNEYDLYTHNLISGETKKFKEDREIVAAYNNYFITRRAMNHNNSDSEQYEHYIEVLKGDKLEEVTSIGELTYFIPADNVVSKKYFYFEKYTKVRDEIENDKTEVKLLRVSKDDLGAEVKPEEVVTLKSSDFVKAADVDVDVLKVTDEYVNVGLQVDPEGYAECFKYTYRTNKIESFEEEE